MQTVLPGPDAEIRWLQRLIVIAAIAMAAFLGLIGIANLALRAADLFALDEAGYGDSYILYDILHLQTDGYVYRDLSEPPYLPAQYSPLLYFVLALPGKLVSFANPFVGPRLIVLAAYLGCMAAVVSITRKLTHQRESDLLILLVAASIAPIWDWILQLRSDFIGLLFSLVTIRLLLAGGRREVWYAGLCAGMAVQMKLTFVAAAISGAVWLALQRRWSDLGRLTLAGVVTSAGLYLIFWVREPRMLAQMMALSPGVPEVPGALLFAARAALEPVMVAALLTAPAVLFANDGRWHLLILFVFVSAAVATATIIQAGANVNYYFELFFASVPLAIGGILLLERSSRPVSYGMTLAVIFGCVIYAMAPRVTNLSREIASWIPVSERNAQLTSLAAVVKSHRIFSTIPRLALFDAEPILVEPFLLSYMGRLGRANYEPVVTPIRQGRPKAVFTAAVSRSYRGIPHIDTELRDAIAAAYEPYCIITLHARGPILVHAPRDHDARDETLMSGLDSFGCLRALPRDVENW